MSGVPHDFGFHVLQAANQAIQPDLTRPCASPRISAGPNDNHTHQRYMGAAQLTLDRVQQCYDRCKGQQYGSMSGCEPCVKWYSKLVLSIQLKPAAEVLVHLHSNRVAQVCGRSTQAP